MVLLGATDLVFNRISVPRYFCGSTAPPGMTGYCVELTCRVGDDRWRNAERLVDWVLDNLVKVGMLKSRRRVIDVKVERVKDSYPIYKKNYPRPSTPRGGTWRQIENLHLAGRTGLFWYNNMDHSMENAMQLTSKLLRDRLHVPGAGRSRVGVVALRARR